MLDLIDELERSNMSKKQIVEMLSDILQTSARSKSILEDYAVENGICPECYSDLEIHEWKEYHEYGSTYATENLCEYICSNCGEEY